MNFSRLFAFLAVLLFSASAIAADRIRPDPQLTPGLIRYEFTADSSADLLCHTKWGLDRRHVTVSMKRAIAAAYHVTWSRRAQYEFDHLVPRELGGADDIRNIWPQPRKGRFNAHLKDVLENKLHRMVCAGQLSLAEAQGSIILDWIQAYTRFVGHIP